jgi:general secretion pathway protein I
MTLRRDPTRRGGLTLLEVLIALGIFLMSLVAISTLVTTSADQALEVQQRSRAAQLCQSKLAEVIAGVVPLSGQGDTPFDEDPAWSWALDAEQGDIAGLWKVTIHVSRQQPNGSRIECSLDRLLLDPSLRGSTVDASTIAAANNANNSSSSSSGSSGSSGGSTGSGAGSTSGGGPTSGGGAGGGAAGAGSGSTSKTGGGGGAPSSGGSGAPSSAPKGTTKGGG